MEGFRFDADRCTGCRACQFACQDHNHLPPGFSFRRVDSWQSGIFPKVSLLHLSFSCHHCSQPTCIPACPHNAITRNENGIIEINPLLCKNCGKCASACSFKLVMKIPGRCTAAKCDTCVDLRQAGRMPVCVDACPMRCLSWGEISGESPSFPIPGIFNKDGQYVVMSIISDEDLSKHAWIPFII